MSGFGKRGTSNVPQQKTEEGMTAADHFVLSPKFPKYMTIGLMGGVLLMFLSGLFRSGLPSLGSLLGMVIPMAVLVGAVYLSFRGMQKQHAHANATRKQLAKYPQLYFWGFAGGALAYAWHSGTTLSQLWADLKASFEPVVFKSGDPAAGRFENTFMGMGHWILGGVLIAYVATLVLDKLKERENAR